MMHRKTKEKRPAEEEGDQPETAAAEGADAPAGADAAPVEEPFAAEAAPSEADQWKDMALRARADLDNYRKRMAQETAEARKYANSALLESLLPILDNFQFGLQAARQEPAAANLLVGLNMVAGQLQNFLRENGLEEIRTVGEKFDPNVHEAVAQEPSAEVPEGVIISEVRRGFRLRERLLRPASVVVSTGPAPEAPEPEERS